MTRKKLFTVILFILISAALSAADRIVVQSGHSGMPAGLVWHQSSGNLISAGQNDGYLIVTDPENSRVLHRVKVTAERIHSVHADRTSQKAAVLHSAGGSYTVSVWDWNDEERVYDYTLDAEPLFVEWSARGRYLLIGNLGSPGIILLDGRTGRRLSYLSRLSSLYNAGYIGSTENILMTYAASGSIRYWDIRSGALKLEAETLPALQGHCVLQTGAKAIMLAFKNDTIYLINRQSGAVVSQKRIPGLLDVSADETNGEIDVLSAAPGGYFLHRFQEENGVLLSRDQESPDGIILNTHLKPTQVLRHDSSTYLITESGTIITDNYRTVLENRIWQPQSMAFFDRYFHIGGADKIFRFESDFFDPDSRIQISDLAGIQKEQLDRISADGIEITEEGELLIHGNSEIHKLFFGRPEDTLYTGFGNIEKLEKLNGETALLVDRSGTTGIFNYQSGQTESSYFSLGILDAAYSVSENYLLTGRSASGQNSTSLEKIDLLTGETVPVSDNRFMVYRVQSSPGGIYTIGVRNNSSGSALTSLRLHNEKNPERSRTILEVQGEDLDALVYPAGRSVYTTLGGYVKKISGRRTISYYWNTPLRELREQGGVLYGLDDEGTILMWDSARGSLLLKITLFRDGSWIAASPDEQELWGSSGAGENVVLFRNGRPLSSRYALRIIDDQPPGSEER